MTMRIYGCEIKKVATSDGKVILVTIAAHMGPETWSGLGDVAGMHCDIDIEAKEAPEPEAADDDNLDMFDDLPTGTSSETPAEHEGMCQHNFEIGKCQLCADEADQAEAAEPETADAS